MTLIYFLRLCLVYALTINSLDLVQAASRYRSNRQMCGHVEHNKATTICCNGLIYVRSGIQPACCGNIGYDSRHYFCCGSTISRKDKYKVPLCCGQKGYDGMFDTCINGYLDKKSDMGSHCCMTEVGWRCCSKGGNCCSHAGSGEVEIPGFRPACCDINSHTEKAECCANTMKNVGSLPSCCDTDNLRPKCCNKADGTKDCCSPVSGYCCLGMAGPKVGNQSPYQPYRPQATNPPPNRAPVYPIATPRPQVTYQPSSNRRKASVSNKQNSNCCSSTRRSCCSVKVRMQPCCTSYNKPSCCRTSAKYSSSCCNNANRYDSLRSLTGGRTLDSEQMQIMTNLKTAKVGGNNRGNSVVHNQQQPNWNNNVNRNNLHHAGQRQHGNVYTPTTQRTYNYNHQDSNVNNRRNGGYSNQNRDQQGQNNNYSPTHSRGDVHDTNSRNHGEDIRNRFEKNCCGSATHGECCRDGYLSSGVLPRCCPSTAVDRHIRPYSSEVTEKMPVYIPDFNQAFESRHDRKIPSGGLSYHGSSNVDNNNNINVYHPPNGIDYKQTEHARRERVTESINRPIDNQGWNRNQQMPYENQFDNGDQDMGSEDKSEDTTVEADDNNNRRRPIIKEIPPPRFVSEHDANFQNNNDLKAQALEQPKITMEHEPSTESGPHVGIDVSVSNQRTPNNEEAGVNIIAEHENKRYPVYSRERIQSNDIFKGIKDPADYFYNIIEEVQFETMRPVRPHVGDMADIDHDKNNDDMQTDYYDPYIIKQTTTPTPFNSVNNQRKSTTEKYGSNIREKTNHPENEIPAYIQTPEPIEEKYPMFVGGDMYPQSNEVLNLKKNIIPLPGESPMDYKMDYYNYRYNYEHENVLCDGEPYDLGVHICCAGVLRFRIGVEPKCCSTEAFDAFIYSCCDDEIRRSCDPDYKPLKTSWGRFI